MNTEYAILTARIESYMRIRAAAERIRNLLAKAS